MNIGKLSLMPSHAAIRKPFGVAHNERDMRELSKRERTQERNAARVAKKQER